MTKFHVEFPNCSLCRIWSWSTDSWGSPKTGGVLGC